MPDIVCEFNANCKHPCIKHKIGVSKLGNPKFKCQYCKKITILGEKIKKLKLGSKDKLTVKFE